MYVCRKLAAVILTILNLKFYEFLWPKYLLSATLYLKFWAGMSCKECLPGIPCLFSFVLTCCKVTLSTCRSVNEITWTLLLCTNVFSIETVQLIKQLFFHPGINLIVLELVLKPPISFEELNEAMKIQEPFENEGPIEYEPFSFLLFHKFKMKTFIPERQS